MKILKSEIFKENLIAFNISSLLLIFFVRKLMVLTLR